LVLERPRQGEAPRIATLGQSRKLGPARVRERQQPTHGVPRVSVEASCVLWAPRAAADPNNMAAASSVLVRRDFDATFSCVVMITAC
jgi:hypothetical protein